MTFALSSEHGPEEILPIRRASSLIGGERFKTDAFTPGQGLDPD